MITKGTIIQGTYEIIDEIGSGGGGIVYKARHIRLDTDVVVKKIRDEVRGRINSRQEADVLKHLKHPYLPRVYDFIESEDGVYTVMDFIPGTALDKLLKQYRYFPQKQITIWANQLAEALAYLHAQEPPIIHSDIKPANIIITPEGNVCLIDFNISLALDGGNTSMGISVGYSAPEQYGDRLYEIVSDTMAQAAGAANATQSLYTGPQTQVLNQGAATEIIGQNAATEIPGQNLATEILGQNAAMEFIGSDAATEVLSQNVTPQPAAQPSATGMTAKLRQVGHVDARSDIYSLGCVLYRIAVGSAPARDFNAMVPISSTDAQISEGLTTIIEKMMQFDPDERYQDGTQLVEALRNIYKLDSRYRAHRRREILLLIASAVLFVAGAALTGLGVRQTGIEQIQTYQTALMKAENYAEDGEYDEALSCVQRLQGTDGSDAECYAREVAYLYYMGDYEGTLDRGEEIIRGQLILGDDETSLQALGDILYAMANASLELEDYANGTDYIERAIEYYQGNSLYYRDYCILLAKQGELSDAQDALDEAERLGIDDASTAFAEGELLAVQGETDEAAEYFETAIATTDDNALKRRAVMLCAQAYEDTGRIGDAIGVLETALADTDGTDRVYVAQYLAAAYMSAGDSASDEQTRMDYYQQALDAYTTMTESGYSSRQVQENIAILKEEVGDLEGAKAALEQMLEDYPDNYRVYMRLTFLEADIQQQKENLDRDYTQMKEYYDKAVELYASAGTEDSGEMLMLENMIQELREGGWFN